VVELEHEEITEQIIGAAFEVYGALGYGFLEKVYQRAMQVELIRRGVPAELEYKIAVHYRNTVVGDYQADLFVADCVIVELKVAKSYNPEDEPQITQRTQSHRRQGRSLDQLWKNQSRIQANGLLAIRPIPRRSSLSLPTKNQ
jgi:GxxExxY protein